jgi:glycerol-3-phosphate dehydrogenase
VRRGVAALANQEYDVVIVGGGIFGICAAWDAALRGLSTVLVERGDFAHATSANCFKIVHGGMRYLQHADFSRIRQSSRERNALLRIAPHLVHPLPFVVPTYGHGLQGKALLGSALRTYDLMTLDRNRGITDPSRRIPPAHSITREECLRYFPGLEKTGLTGAVIFYDGQMHSPPRLALSFLKSALQEGAEAVNYVEATSFLQKGTRIYGIKARDMLTGAEVEIRGRVVLNAAGPWATHLLKRHMGLHLKPELTFSRDAYFVVPRSVSSQYALAVQGRTKDPDAVLSRGKRHLFIVPWNDSTLIGVWHVVHRGEPDQCTVTAEDLEEFIREVNETYPPLALTLKDVSVCHAGLVLFGENKAGARDLSYGKRSQLIDHAKEHGVEGLLTLIGVRFTTSRAVAEQAIDSVLRKLGRVPRPSTTATMPIYGGRIEHFDEFLRQATLRRPSTVSAEVMAALLHNHGAAYTEVLEGIDEDPRRAETVGASTVMKAEVEHAVRKEMAQKLADIIFRRTDLGAVELPGKALLRWCADLMAVELGWDEHRVQEEIREVTAAYPSF